MAGTYFLVLIALSSVISFNAVVKASCGGFIHDTSGVITTPYYPSKYPPNHRCTWEIKVPANKRIGLTFKHMKMEANCARDYARIRSRLENGSYIEHGNYCTKPADTIVSESNVLLIEFVSDGSIEYEGFELEYFTVFSDCGGFIEEKVGVITSPKYNSTYPANMNCIWTIQAPSNNTIKLKFEKFWLEPGYGCNFDYLTVKSKMADGDFQENGKFCGSVSPAVITSASNVLLIQFVSDRNNQERGFLIHFSSEEWGGVIKENKGNISTPFYPYPYPANKMYEWTIQVPPQHKIKLRFNDLFEIEEGDGINCKNDFLMIQSKTVDGEIHDYGTFCGDYKPSDIFSNDSIILKFVSDRSVQKRGFQAEYFIDKWSDYELQPSLLKSTPSPDSTTRDMTTPKARGISKHVLNNLTGRRLLTSRNDFKKEM